MARILIVDDSAIARKTLGNIITSLGHSVAGEAVNGIQACEEYARLKPDVVTMDLTMDISDGLQATSEIIAAFPEARIIVVSARQDQSLMLDALERGARHFIVKPIVPDKVAAVLDNVLRQAFDTRQQLELIRRLRKACTLPGESGAGLPAGNKRQPVRVLIVDDSAVARKSLREIVTALGDVVVGEAANGAQAFVEYTRVKPDVVTMDLTMQGMGGAEAISKIIAAYPEARIIVVSAMEARRGVIDALERGARHFIIKQIRQEKLGTVLDNVMKQEFDLYKHKERIHKLQEAEDSASALDSENEFLAPYAINVQGNNSLIHVVINQTITMTGCETLFLELEEHLEGKPRVLLDFGAMTRIDQDLLIKFNELITAVGNNSGMVKAVSNNKRFVEGINSMQTGNKANMLADVLRFLEA